jgi:hypothetical protein
MIEPLLSQQQRLRTTWISWKAHVRLAVFVLRYTYDAEKDGAVCDALVNDYDKKFDAAYPSVYRKPKHHCIKHLRKYLELYGPFRNYSCLVGESFLQHIKRFFESCNWKCAPQSVGRLWSMKRKFNLMHGHSIDDIEIEAASELLVGSALQAAATSSPLIHSALVGHNSTVAMRYLRRIKRGPLTINNNDWIYDRSTEDCFIGRLHEMAINQK